MHGHVYRTRSAENVVAEFEYIVNELPDVKEVVIEDDTFTINKERTQKICRMLIEKGINKKIKWLCNARVNLDYETMGLMKKAGCKLIIPGIENGTQEMLNNMKKGTTIKQIEEYIKKAKKAKLPKLPKRVKFSKSDKKKKKAREKAVNAALGVVAVLLCVISSVLDVLSNKEKERI